MRAPEEHRTSNTPRRTSNIEHSTSNIEVKADSSILDVQCSMFAAVFQGLENFAWIFPRPGKSQGALFQGLENVRLAAATTWRRRYRRGRGASMQFH
jgi:hypothetical protein